MEEKIFAIIEIGSNNTKVHVFKNKDIIYSNSVTIEFKKNYNILNKIDANDINKLFAEIERVKNHTNNIYIFGCSIFRNITDKELKEFNDLLYEKHNLNISVVTQEEEALLTVQGCYNDYNGNVCIFIGGGGSTELLLLIITR